MFQVTMTEVPGIVDLLNLCFPDKRFNLVDVVHHLPTLIIAKEEDQVIACCWFKCTFTQKTAIAEIKNLCVHPDFRKKGYATFMMKDACLDIGRLGVKKVLVECVEPDLFLRYGFKVVDQLPRSKTYLMTRELV